LRNLRIQEEGVYIFGGRNKLGELSNKLTIMQFDNNNKFIGWLYPEVRGILPPERCSHKMEFYPIINSLLLYGGRDDRTG